jgi:hypothetical protein
MVNDKGRVADDGADEFFLGDLFEVGEAKFREKFLSRSSDMAIICKQGGNGTL